MAWYIAVPTTIALFNPRNGSFNVTAKGGFIDERHPDWKTARPYIILLVINLIALGWGIYRIFFGSHAELLALFITVFWVIYNLAILGGAIGVDIEARQTRAAPRVEFSMQAALIREDGHAMPCILKNYSGTGVGIELEKPDWLEDDKKVYLILNHNQEEYSFPCSVVRTYGLKAGLQLDNLTVQQYINFIQCTFGRADTWAIWQNKFKEEKTLNSLMSVVRFDMKGYVSALEFTPKFLRKFITNITRGILWIFSFAPRNIITAPNSATR